MAEHGVQFYPTPEALAEIVAAFLAEGLRNGEPALLIATPERLALIEKRLVEAGLNPNGLKWTGDLLVLDAQAVVDMVLINGSPSAELFRETMKRFLDQLCRGREGCRMRAFADVIDLLWRGEITAAVAIRLETLWNELAAERGAGFLSSYAIGHFYKGPMAKTPISTGGSSEAIR